MTNSLKKVCKLMTNANSARLNLKIMADEHCTKQQNKVCKCIHWAIQNEYSIPTKEIWLHDPEPVTANEDVTIFYDSIIPLDLFRVGLWSLILWCGIKKRNHPWLSVYLCPIELIELKGEQWQCTRTRRMHNNNNKNNSISVLILKRALGSNFK